MMIRDIRVKPEEVRALLTSLKEKIEKGDKTITLWEYDVMRRMFFFFFLTYGLIVNCEKKRRPVFPKVLNSYKNIKKTYFEIFNFDKELTFFLSKLESIEKKINRMTSRYIVKVRSIQDLVFLYDFIKKRVENGFFEFEYFLFTVKSNKRCAKTFRKIVEEKIQKLREEKVPMTLTLIHQGKSQTSLSLC